MVIPFGVGVGKSTVKLKKACTSCSDGVFQGDFIAVAKLIHQIAPELTRNPEFAADYQDLVIELQALDRGLKQLQVIQPARHVIQSFEAIRALAVACRGPLEAFLEVISMFETCLGPWKSPHGHFRRFSRRLQWSTMYKEDIAALKARLAPKSATVTILLLTQTTSSLAKSESTRET
jgi:hypothetical protein